MCSSDLKARGISHITGGGFYENIPRSIPDGFCARINKDSVRVPDIFRLIAKEGNVTERDMFNTFNMGVGMSVIVSPEDEQKATDILKDNDIDAYTIGGANYFKLRDLGEAPGFTVDWDSSSKTVLITTGS